MRDKNLADIQTVSKTPTEHSVLKFLLSLHCYAHNKMSSQNYY